MIKPGEIQKKARISGIRDQQVEKDYILSWILQGVANHGKLAKAIVFKSRLKANISIFAISGKDGQEQQIPFFPE